MCSALIGAAAVARADTAIVFPHAGDSRLQSEREAAFRAVMDALEEQGLDVRVQARRARSSAEVSSDCAQVTCAAAMLSAAAAQLAVAVAVWQAENAVQVNITLVDARGARYPGHAPVIGQDVSQAVRAALVEARGLQLLGPGPWLLVRGEPAGASVIIDGKLAGSLPLRAALSPGDHALEVQAEGYAAKQQAIVVPLEPTSIARVDVALAANAKVAPAPAYPEPRVTSTMQDDGSTAPNPLTEYEAPPVRDSASVWNFAIGGALAAGGLALATIQPIQTASRAGDCANAACTQTYQVGGETALQVVAGVVLVGAGITFMIWQPLRVQTEIGPTHALLRLRTTL